MFRMEAGGYSASGPRYIGAKSLQEVNCATVGHARFPVSDHVFAHPHCVCLVAKQRQRNSRVASNVLDLLVHSQMGHHELFALNSDPHYGDLRAAVRVERGQMSERSFFDHFAYCLRNLHECLSFNASSCNLLFLHARQTSPAPWADFLSAIALPLVNEYFLQNVRALETR